MIWQRNWICESQISRLSCNQRRNDSPCGEFSFRRLGPSGCGMTLDWSRVRESDSGLNVASEWNCESFLICPSRTRWRSRLLLGVPFGSWTHVMISREDKNWPLQMPPVFLLPGVNNRKGGEAELIWVSSLTSSLLLYGQRKATGASLHCWPKDPSL